MHTDYLKEQQEKALQDQRAREFDDFKNVLSTESGRRVIRLIFARCRMGHQSYVSGNTHDTAFNEGAKTVGRWLDDQLMQHGDNYIKILMGEK